MFCFVLQKFREIKEWLNLQILVVFAAKILYKKLPWCTLLQLSLVYFTNVCLVWGLVKGTLLLIPRFSYKLLAFGNFESTLLDFISLGMFTKAKLWTAFSKSSFLRSHVYDFQMSKYSYGQKSETVQYLSVQKIVILLM